MKKIIYLLVLIALVSCHQQEKKSNGMISKDAVDSMAKSDQDLQSIIQANINKTPTIDTVFLGFSFNMTNDQVTRHYLNLLKEKKLIKGDGNAYYEMNLSIIKAHAFIAPEFHDNKLYKLTLVITPADDMATAKTVFFQTETAYLKKYSGYAYFEAPGLVDPDLKEAHWIKNNLHIYIRDGAEGTLVSYINMPAERDMKKNEDMKTDSAAKQTGKDI